MFNFNNNGRDILDYLSYEEQVAYDNAKTVADSMLELAKLRRENEQMQKKARESEDYIDQQYKNTMNQTAQILNTLLEKEEKAQ